MTTPKLDLATVFYSGDAVLMQLQARSIVRFMDHAAIGSIKLVENDDPGAISQQARDKILDSYGPLRDRVEFITREELGYKDTHTKDGWRIQQALKLSIGQRCDTPFLLLLDCKNHLVRPVNFLSFFTEDGRSRQYFSRKFDPRQVHWLEKSWRYFHINRQYTGETLPSTITPYPICVPILNALYKKVAKRDGSVFHLMSRPDFEGTEFYLLLAYIQSHYEDLSEVFQDGLARPATLFSSWPQNHADLSAIIHQAETGQTNCFALHPKRQPPLTPAEWQRIQALWTRLDLLVPEVVQYYEERRAARVE